MRSLSFRDFGGNFWLSVIIESPKDTLLELAMIENLRFAVGIFMTFVILLELGL